MLCKEMICPVCAYRMDAHQAINEKEPVEPSPGDITICLNCTAVLEFERNQVFKIISGKELVEIKKTNPEIVAIIYAVSALKKKFGYRTYQSRFN